MPILFIANKNYSSWSLRPWVLMKTLGLPFEERLMPFEADSRSVYRQFSPSGQVPTLKDGDVTVWDSLGIAEYLAEAHPAVWPASREARAFARSISAEMHSSFEALRSDCTFNAGLRIRLKETRPALVRDIARIDEIFCHGLSRFGGPFVAGPTFTAADAMFAPIAFRVQTYGLTLSKPAAAYVAQLLALPAMREWYEGAIAETFREEGHEADARSKGEWLQDFRAGA